MVSDARHHCHSLAQSVRRDALSGGALSYLITGDIFMPSHIIDDDDNGGQDDD